MIFCKNQSEATAGTAVDGYMSCEEFFLGLQMESINSNFNLQAAEAAA